MDEIVCQVTNRENQVEFIWSAGGGFFRPYAVAGAQLGELRGAAGMVRKALGEMVSALNFAGDGDAPSEPAYGLAEAGFRLYNYVLPSEDETARKVRRWLEDLRKQTRLDALEIVVEEQSADPRAFLCVPWNVIYDERPAKYKSAFQSGKGVERWRPFWSIRYNLTSGRRVEPLKRLPVWSEPRVIVVVDPDVYGHLEDEQRGLLDAFLSETGLTMASSMEELEAALEEGYPRLLYWLGHANPEYLQLGPQRIAPSDLRNLLRSFDDRERPEGMLAFLNACQTAEAGLGGSFLDVLHSFGFTGAIATEQQTIDTFANKLGLAFLRGFLQEGRPLGELLHELRLKMAPLGLLYGAHCPPEIRVKTAAEGPGAALHAIEEISRVFGVALKAPAVGAVAVAVAMVAAPPELPEQPYRSLGYYDRADRALFTGREADIVRFAARLDRSDTRLLILHGESGLGKSSFLRAGVIPYLEEHCVGYRFLRKADDVVAIIHLATDPVGQIAQALLEMTARPLTYPTPTGETIEIDLRRTIDEVLAGPADFEALRAALTNDAGLFSSLLVKMAAELPHALVLVIDQAEEIFTLSRSPAELEVRDHTLVMIQRVIDLKADVKLILSLRTEYIGRLLDHLRAGRADLNGVRDDLLRDFSHAALVAAIERPTLASPIAEGRTSPREKYGFRFAEGVAVTIANGVLELRTEHQDSVLPLIQVICTQLYERERSRPDSGGLITHEDLEAIRGVEGGLRAYVEGALEHTLELDPPDREAFKSLFTRLYTRQMDGTLTTWLASRAVLASFWIGSVSFDRVVRAAVSVRLLREDSLRVEGTEPRPYIRLGHDALAKVAAAWQAERDEEERLQQERAQVEQERKRRREQIRKLVAGVCLAAGLAILFGATGVWALYQKRLADDNAHAARISSAQARSSEKAAKHSAKEAKQSLRIASKGVDDLMTEVAAVDLADVPQMAPVRTRLLDKARKAYERLREENADQEEPELLWVAARSLGRIGEVLFMLGQFRDAEDSYRDAVHRLGSLAEQYPAGARPEGDRVREDLGWDILRDLVWTRLGLATLLKDLYRLDEAEDQLRQAAAFGRALEGSRHLSDRELLNAIGYQRGVLLERKAKLRGSTLSRDTPEIRESEEAYRKAIRDQQALVEEGRGQATGGATAARGLVQQRTELGRFRNNLGMLLEESGRYKEADDEFREVLKILASERSPGSRWQRARAEHNLGALLLLRAGGATGPEKNTLFEPGLKPIREAKDLLEDLRRDFPEVPQYREELAEVCKNLGNVEQRMQQNAQAMNDLRQAEELFDQLVGEFPTVPKYRVKSAEVCQLMVRTLKALHDAARAESYARKSIEHLTSLAGLSPDMSGYVGPSLGLSYQQLALILTERDDFDGARAAIEKAVGCHQAARSSRPENRVYRSYLWYDYRTSSVIRLKLRDIAGAAKDAEELPRLVPDDAGSYTVAASLLIECAKASPDQGAHFYDRAMELLRKGVEQHKLDPSRLDLPALKALRDREDFRRLRQSPKPLVAG